MVSSHVPLYGFMLGSNVRVLPMILDAAAFYRHNIGHIHIDKSNQMVTYKDGYKSPNVGKSQRCMETQTYRV